MNKVLLICMSRMGDILQSVHVCKALKENKDNHVTVLARKSFSGVLNKFEYIDDVILFDSESVLGSALDGNMKKYKENIVSFVNDLNERGFDEVVNLTFSSSSALITYLVKANKKKGLSISRDGEVYHEGLWSNYFNGAVLNRTVNSINLVDIFLNIAEVKHSGMEKVTPNELKIADKSLEALVDEKDYIIAIQLGASADNKRWSTQNFSGVAKLILRSDYFSKSNIKFILIGSGSEEELGREFLSHMGGEKGKVINLIGKTNLTELWNVLYRSNLLITNDTGPMHMASILGVPIVNIPLGPVKFQETAPYSENSIVVAPNIECYPCSFQNRCLTQRCKFHVKPHDVYQAVKILDELMFSATGDFSEDDADIEYTRSSTMYLSKFVKDNSGARQIEYLPLNEKDLDEKILSELICNTSIKSDLSFNLQAASEIVERVKKYNYENFNFSQFYQRLSYSFSKINAAVKDSINVLKNIKKEYSRGNIDAANTLLEKLLDKDVLIVKNQDDNLISHYLMGLFQSFKAANIGDLSSQIEKNFEIYSNLLNSIGVIKILALKVLEEFTVELKKKSRKEKPQKKTDTARELRV